MFKKLRTEWNASKEESEGVKLWWCEDQFGVNWSIWISADSWGLGVHWERATVWGLNVTTKNHYVTVNLGPFAVVAEKERAV